MFVYLLHFQQPISHARHYLGVTNDLTARMLTHAGGNGAAITKELHRLGIGFTLVRAWDAPSGRVDEKLFKKQKNGPRFCPLCYPHEYQKSIQGLQSISASILQRSGIKTDYTKEIR